MSAQTPAAAPEALDATAVRPSPAAELQQWLDAAEAENEKLRAQVKELEQRPAAAPASAATELQQWLDAAEAENEKLRAQVKELEQRAQGGSAQAVEPRASGGSSTEVQQRLDAAEAENQRLQSQVQELTATADQAERLRRELVELQCVLAAETESHAAAPKAAPSGASEARAIELQTWLDAAEAENGRLREELAKARPDVVGAGGVEVETLRERLAETEAALQAMRGLNARFSEQIETTAKRDLKRLEEELAKAKAAGDPQRIEALELALTDAKGAIETLTAERTAALEQVRRYVGADDAATTEKLAAKDKRISDLEAEVLGQAEDLHGFRTRIAAWERRDGELTKQIDELRARACDAEVKVGELLRALEATETREAQKDARVVELERTTTEQTAWLEQGEKDRARLEAELAALRTQAKPPPAPPDATEPDAPPESADDALVDEAQVKAVVQAPLAAVEQLAEAQAAATKEAVTALAAEQHAREALITDLQWLKDQVEQLSNVREDLRHRIAAMVKRELDRKALLHRLLAKLRDTEVAQAVRVGALRRLQAAVEQAQRMAVKVQTIYFQKQIGSLQRQLEKERRAPKRPAA